MYVVCIVIAEGIHSVAVGERHVPMLQRIAVRIHDFQKTIVAQPFHVAHFIAFRERGMGRHDEAAPFSQLIDSMLFHVEILHEREVGPIHLFRPDAYLVCLADEAVAVFVCGDIVLSLSTMRVDAHII